MADLHLGKAVNGFSQLEDQRHILNRIVEMVDRHEVDVLLMAGDVYDKTQPSAEAVTLLDDFLTQLATRPVQVIGIPGNHDSAERIAYGARMLNAAGIHLAPLYNGSIEPVTLEDEHGTVAFWPLPFLRPAQVRPFFPDARIKSDYTQAVAAAIAAMDVDPTVRNVAVAHQFVTARGFGNAADTSTCEEGANGGGPRGEAGAAPDDLPMRSDSEAFVGSLDNVDVRVFAPFEYTALGHLHRAQAVGGNECVRYSGSPLKYSASEAPFPKTAPLVTLGPKGTEPQIELLPLIPLRDMRRIAGPLEALVDPEVVAAANRNDYVHAVITDATMPINARAALRGAYPNLMTLSHHPSRQDSAATWADEDAKRFGQGDCADDTALAVEPAAQTDPEELFAHLFEMQNGRPLDPEQTELVSSVVRKAWSEAFGTQDDSNDDATGNAGSANEDADTGNAGSANEERKGA